MDTIAVPQSDTTTTVVDWILQVKGKTSETVAGDAFRKAAYAKLSSNR